MIKIDATIRSISKVTMQRLSYYNKNYFFRYRIKSVQFYWAGPLRPEFQLGRPED